MGVDVQGGPTHHRASRGRLSGWGAGDDGGFLLLITLGDTQVDSVESSHVLGIIITRDLKWELRTTDLRQKPQKGCSPSVRLPGPIMARLYRPS